MKFHLDKETQTLTADEAALHYIFISDIHGTGAALPLIQRAQQDYPDAQFVGGGDYIDGRPEVKEVCDFLIDQSEHHNAVILEGNHEAMMLNFADDVDETGLWYFNGGKRTVRGFFGREFSTPEAEQALRDSPYYGFFKKAPIMFDTPHIVFLHAGILPRANYSDVTQYPEGYDHLNGYDFYRLWAREEYFLDDEGFMAHNKSGKTIVTGHTPTALITGRFDDGRVLRENPFDHCCVRVISYPHEPSRILCDGGCHAMYPGHDGNVVVMDSYGKLLKVYDHDHPEGVDWPAYAKENQRYLAY